MSGHEGTAHKANSDLSCCKSGLLLAGQPGGTSLCIGCRNGHAKAGRRGKSWQNCTASLAAIPCADFCRLRCWGYSASGLAYLCIKYSGHRLVPQKEYGSARWGTAADIAPFLHEKASENIPLTATESLSLAMKMQVTAENNYNRNKNVIVFGPSGSGKSYSVAGPQLMQFNSNYVLSDPKGELLDTYGNVLVSQGYDVKVFNLKDRDKSDHYNPFAYIHDTDDIVVVAKNLIKNMKEDPRQKNTADPIWKKALLHCWKRCLPMYILSNHLSCTI